MKIVYHRDADLEMREAAAYLDAQGEGRGDRFFDAIEQRLEAVARMPGLARPDPDAPSDLEVRLVLLRQFAYTLVLVLLSEDRALLIAVAHEAREPGYWRSRLGG